MAKSNLKKKRFVQLADYIIQESQYKNLEAGTKAETMEELAYCWLRQQHAHSGLELPRQPRKCLTDLPVIQATLMVVAFSQ